jgi:PTS system cellobiose-specific IIC component
MPEGVPPAIANAFAALIPGAVIVFGWWFIRFPLGIDIAEGMFQVLSRIVPVASSYIAVAIAETFHAFLWTMGIHGDLTIGIALEPVWTANLAANAQAVANGQEPTAIYTNLFRSYVVPGGLGANWCDVLPLAFYLMRSNPVPVLNRIVVHPGHLACALQDCSAHHLRYADYLNPVLAIPFSL